MDPRTGLAPLLAAAGLALAAHSADAEACGPVEDAERASYRALAWSDFQGPAPDPGVRGGDRNLIVIQVSLRIDALAVATEPLPDGGFRARAERPCVRAYVLKQRSARRPSARLVWQLAHEQGHLDLAQLHAQRLSRQLTGLSAGGASPIAAERRLWVAAERAYQAASAQHAQSQRRYDRETRHGHLVAGQLAWASRIRAEIAPL